MHCILLYALYAEWVAQLVCFSPYLPNNVGPRSVDFHDAENRQHPYCMIMQHVKNFLSACLAWVLSVKLNSNVDHGRPAKKFEDAELQALLDEDFGQTQEHLAEQLNFDQSTVSCRLKAMGKIIKVGRWKPHELTDRQQENRKIVCEMFRARYKCKSYHQRIVSSDEKWIYFENRKCNPSYVEPGQPSKSTSRPNGFGRKTMLCIFWDQEGPIYIL
ncbi:mariner Mos1 transposase [Trichonephila clavipes]|nr:mariner Mos1 transposase [Trichonephila clavipes]